MPDSAACDAVANLPIQTTSVWGLPLARVTFRQTVEEIDRLIALREPAYVVTANLHYAMLAARDARLMDHSRQAAMVVADGMPLVWASRWRDHPLPERVTGSDLVPMLCELAENKNYGIYLFGAGPGVAEQAKQRLLARHPRLRIVGVQSPPFRQLDQIEEQAMVESIRAAEPDLLFAALGQPKGEYWVAEYYQRLQVPVTIQIGATLDFISQNVLRAPKWMQRLGCEWLYRLTTDPRRLAFRYVQNIAFALKMLLRDMLTRRGDRR